MSLFSSPGTGNHLMLPREHGGQGAQKDPYTAALHGRILQLHSIIHILIVLTGSGFTHVEHAYWCQRVGVST